MSLTFDISKDSNILAGDEVNRNTFPAKTSTSADTVDVVFSVAG